MSSSLSELRTVTCTRSCRAGSSRVQYFVVPPMSRMRTLSRSSRTPRINASMRRNRFFRNRWRIDVVLVSSERSMESSTSDGAGEEPRGHGVTGATSVATPRTQRGPGASWRLPPRTSRTNGGSRSRGLRRLARRRGSTHRDGGAPAATRPRLCGRLVTRAACDHPCASPDHEHEEGHHRRPIMNGATRDDHSDQGDRPAGSAGLVGRIEHLCLGGSMQRKERRNRQHQEGWNAVGHRHIKPEVVYRPMHPSRASPITDGGSEAKKRISKYIINSISINNDSIVSSST